ncbi:MAG: Fructose-1,6-bisphosphatase, type I (EC [uncultured Thiotrichaceae bacterium]|uniref:Fructose-1,6-bisphosphatase class 1 n=1 Tax=uncultured Thiotrichaceae bacterium TaxID=298394 RepID=A0A6S6TIM4_9GAMM|nr:MAG: Fructose-1,6-bisphosphatase, type I (EC [uncultured Thiotrichaceae bacterium]
MNQPITLSTYLHNWAGKYEINQQVEATINALAEGSMQIADLASTGGALATDTGNTDQGGDYQKILDQQAHEILLNACQQTSVAVVGSEEAPEVINLDASASLVVVMDPLDGSANIKTNAPTGTIFSLYPLSEGTYGKSDAAALLKGTEQLAAAYVIYGTQTALALTLGEGTHLFILDRQSRSYVLTRENIQVPKVAKEYSVNASNQDFWHDSIQNYVDDCITGYADHKQKFNMRWVASLVAEAHRIFARGGVFLYPSDSREGDEPGRLRLVYEANAMAFLMEQAGGAATDCSRRIMDIQPEHLHQKTPLVMGSEANVEQVTRYQNFEEEGHYRQGKAPLFGSRGLFISGRGNY